MRTVGVTGTNGKTTTTTLIAAALPSPVVRITTVGFFLDDEEQDVPRTHASAVELVRRSSARSAAVEYTSEALARGYAKLWPADVAVFTNLTHDHLDAHRSPEHYLASKAQLFMHAREAAVLNACDPSSALLAEVTPVPIVTYGVPSRGEPALRVDHHAQRVEASWEGTAITLVDRTLTTRAVGEVFAENALAAYVAAITAGVDPDHAARAIAAAAPPRGRFEVIARDPAVVIDYAHTPDALARTLQTARRLCAGTLHVVFGAGGNRDRDKRAPMGAAASVADHVVLTTDNPRDEDPAQIAAMIREGVTTTVTVELDRARAIEQTIRDAGARDVIVIAGKGHERTQTIGAELRAFDDAAVARAAHRAQPQ